MNPISYLTQNVTSTPEFRGAFFAFIFSIIFFAFTRSLFKIAEQYGKRKQKIKNYNIALFNIEIYTNEIGNIVNDNIYLLRDFLKLIESKTFNKGSLTTISKISIDLTTIPNINIVNEILIYNSRITKLSFDISNSNEFQRELTKELRGQKEETPEQKFELNNLIENKQNLLLFQVAFQEELINFITRVRLIRNTLNLDKTVFFKNLKSLDAISEKEEKFKNEKKKIVSQLEADREKDKKRIEEIINESK